MRMNARQCTIITILLAAIFNISGHVYAEVNIPDANAQSLEHVLPSAVHLAKE